MTEDKPHIVKPKAVFEGPVQLCQNYADAYTVWKALHHFKFPYVIMSTTGRVIDPSTPVVDVNE